MKPIWNIFTARESTPMKTVGFVKIRVLCGLFIFIFSRAASAETPMELFNPAAREYIIGNTPTASNLVVRALQKYPNDEKLQKLKELIEQQQQQNQDQQNQDQQNQDQQNQDQQNQDQQNQEQQNQEQQNQDQQNQEEQQNQEQEQSGEEKPQEAQPSQAQPQLAGQMSEEEAKQLLDAMKLNEKDQRTDLRPILGRPVRVDKDW
jgi:type IV secretory pathway VirB10-like protein